MPPLDAPTTRWAKTSDDVHVAYQVVGEGPVELLVVATVLGLGYIWRVPRAGGFFRRLPSFSRLLVFDRRGAVSPRTFPLIEAADAMRYLEGGHPTGKVVVTV
jgi:hypothetical protein